MKGDSFRINAWNSLKDISWVVFFTIMPTLCNILLTIFDQNSSFWEKSYYSSGEFILYTVSLLCSSYIVLEYHSKKTRFVTGGIIMFSIAYGSITMLLSNDKKLDLNVIKIVSYIGIGMAIWACWYSTYIQHANKIPETDAQRDNNRSQGLIENGLQ